MSRTIPVPSEPLLTRSGQINPIWWRYLRSIESHGDSSGVQEQIREILRRLAEIPEAREVIGRMSVVVIDQPDGTRSVQLEGDSLTPGSNAFYCTDPIGRRQWAALSQMIGASDGIVFTDSGYTIMGELDEPADLPETGEAGQAWWIGPVLYAWGEGEDGPEWLPDYSPSGLLEITLSDITPEDGGTLQRTAFDDKGRRTHEGGATTDDLPEGSGNLYYTDARAEEAAPIQSIVAGANVSVDVTDPRNPVVSSTGGGGAVDSVNGKTGVVVLDAVDVWADPAGSAAAAQAAAVQRGNHTGSQLANTISNFAATVRTTTLTGLSLATSAAITAADSVLAALGKLQAQISGKVSKSGDSITGDLLISGNVESTTATVHDTLFMSSADALIRSVTNDNRIALTGGSGLSASSGAFFFAHGTSHPTFPGLMQVEAGIGADIVLGAGAGRGVVPRTSNNRTLGSASNLWSVVYAGTGSINTSDAREKDNIRELTAAEIDAAQELAAAGRIYQWRDALSEKGEEARLHCSPTVQSVIATMESHGLDPFRYGFVCHDEWDELPELRDPETGEVMQEFRPAGDRYSLRPSELGSFIAAGMAEKVARLEARLAAMEPA